jgi:hypothetical protein
MALPPSPSTLIVAPPPGLALVRRSVPPAPKSPPT